MNLIETKDRGEAKTILDNILIKRSSRSFAEFPYKIIDFGYADEAKKNIGEPFYNAIIWKP